MKTHVWWKRNDLNPIVEPFEDRPSAHRRAQLAVEQPHICIGPRASTVGTAALLTRSSRSLCGVQELNLPVSTLAVTL